MTEDLPVFILHHLGLSNRNPLHVEELVAVRISRGDSQRNGVLSVELKTTDSHQESWKESPINRQDVIITRIDLAGYTFMQ